jgi:hypothetical protein
MGAPNHSPEPFAVDADSSAARSTLQRGGGSGLGRYDRIDFTTNLDSNLEIIVYVFDSGFTNHIMLKK